jgi:CHAT domain
MRDNKQSISVGHNSGIISANTIEGTSLDGLDSYLQEQNSNPLSVKKILILSANPGDTGRLRLDQEVRGIQEGLKRSKHSDHFQLHQQWAVNFSDLSRALIEYEPHILHFAGHGDKEGLRVEGELGISVSIDKNALAGLFELCAHHVECVILNACYSGTQVSAIKKHIKYVIGMKREMKDKAAIEFAVSFYDALGAGKTVEEAFKYGRIAIMQIFPGLTEHLVPVLKR